VNTDGTGFQVLRHFGSTTDGANPQGGLTLASNALYGVNHEGGTHGVGTLFSIETNGSGFRVLRHLNYSTDGGYPEGGLTLASNVLLGINSSGGAYDGGSLFSVKIDATAFQVLRHFNRDTDGAIPDGGLALAGNLIYGVARDQYSHALGSVFRFDPSLLAIMTAAPVSLFTGIFETAVFAVTAAGPNLSYQWYFNGAPIASATNATLTLPHVKATNVGSYSVSVSNANNTVVSPPVLLSLFGDLRLNAGTARTVLAGSIGQQFRVDYADVVTVGATNWLTLTNVTLLFSPFYVDDRNSAGRTQRYYRAVPVP
jgi:hypothetical protein